MQVGPAEDAVQGQRRESVRRQKIPGAEHQQALAGLVADDGRQPRSGLGPGDHVVPEVRVALRLHGGPGGGEAGGIVPDEGEDA